MRKIFTILILFINMKSYSNSFTKCDTISYWKVYRNSKLIKEGNITNKKYQIELTKGTIKVLDTLFVKYFDDIPCIKCNSKFIIRTEKGKEIKIIQSSKNQYSVKLKTTELQVLAFKNKSSILKLYFKEDEKTESILLFEFKIK
jgi:hypothetical protein